MLEEKNWFFLKIFYFSISLTSDKFNTGLKTNSPTFLLDFIHRRVGVGKLNRRRLDWIPDTGYGGFARGRPVAQLLRHLESVTCCLPEAHFQAQSLQPIYSRPIFLLACDNKCHYCLRRKGNDAEFQFLSNRIHPKLRITFN